MKRSLSLVLLAALGLPCLAADDAARLNFKANGFSIDALEGSSDTTPYQAVIMFLPASDGFAPNVNVQIQPYKGTLKEYADLSRQQFKAMDFPVVSEKVSQTFVTWEYSGKIQGQQLHWYAKAESKAGKVYLVTATATESQWKAVSGKLKACVDSFRIEKGEQDASSLRR